MMSDASRRLGTAVRRAAGRPNPLPAGALTVGTGLLVLGASAYGYLSVSARALGPERFATLSVLWVLVFTVGPGLFLPLEQEVGRAVAARRAVGDGGGPVLRRAGVLGLGLLAAVLAGCLAARPWLQGDLLRGDGAVFAALLLAVVGLAPAHLSRGALAGTGRFGAYGAQLALDGVLRLVGVVLLALAGVATAGPYGLVLGLASLLAVAVTVGDPRRVARPGQPAAWRELSGSLGWLLAGALLAQGLANAGVLAVGVLAGPSEKVVAGQFLAGLVLARLPLFLFAAVQAVLLPGLAAHAGAGRLDQVRAGLRRICAVVLAVTAVSGLAAAVAGPPVLRAVFGAGFGLPRGALVVLALACGAYMLAVVAGQGLVAVRAPAPAAAGWAVGMVAFVLVVAVGTDLVGRVERGFLGGSVAAAAALAAWLASRLRRLEAGELSRARPAGPR